MNSYLGMGLILILFFGIIANPLAYSQSKVLADEESQNMKNEITEIKEFDTAKIKLSSKTSAIKEFDTAKIKLSSKTSAIKQLKNVIFILNSSTTVEIDNLGGNVSEVAKLHKLLVGKDTEEQKEFQKLFSEFKEIVTNIQGMAQGIKQQMITQDLQKSELKLQMQLAKEEQLMEIENKIKSTNQMVKQKKEFKNLQTKIAIIQTTEYGSDRTEKLVDLIKNELEMIDSVFDLEEKINEIYEILHNNKKSTGEITERDKSE